MWLKEQKLGKEAKKQKAELKEKLKTLSDYKADLQKEVNQIIRLIDAGHPCISSQRPIEKGQVNAGHLYAVGSNPALRFNLFNIYNQSIEQNKNKGGAPLEFLEGLEQYFGTAHKEAVLALKARYSVLKLSADELKEAIQKARSIIKWLKLQERQFTTEERINLRHRFNEELGIYK